MYTRISASPASAVNASATVSATASTSRPSLFSRNRFVKSIAAALCLSFAVGATNVAHAEVKIGLSDWPGWVAWYVAEQKGFFKKYNAKVKLVWFANYTDSISAGTWLSLTNLTTRALPTFLTVADNVPAVPRFYRLLTPEQP